MDVQGGGVVVGDASSGQGGRGREAHRVTPVGQSWGRGGWEGGENKGRMVRRRMNQKDICIVSSIVLAEPEKHIRLPLS